jgi:hypothetical protein
MTGRRTPDRVEAEGLNENTRIRPSSTTQTAAMVPKRRTSDAES